MHVMNVGIFFDADWSTDGRLETKDFSVYGHLKKKAKNKQTSPCALLDAGKYRG